MASVMTSVTSSSVLVGARSQGDPVVVTASVMTSAAVLAGGVGGWTSASPGESLLMASVTTLVVAASERW